MNVLLKLGLVAGIFGLLLTLASFIFRLAGTYWVAGFQVGTLLQAGIAATVSGCFFLLAVLTGRNY